MNTEIIKIDRETMIDHLTASMFDAMAQDDDYMVCIIQGGFAGFNNFSDDELLQEYRDYISEDPNHPVVLEITA